MVPEPAPGLEVYAALQADLLDESRAETERLRQLLQDVVLELGGYSWDEKHGAFVRTWWMGPFAGTPARIVEILNAAGCRYRVTAPVSARETVALRG